ncbi:hypothetical protein ACFL6S_01985 [Candidatus Poribacteria bacterium]
MRLKTIFASVILLLSYMISACGELYPFVDINDVTRIRVSENHISFYSKNGFRSLGLESGKWDIGFYDHPKPKYKPSKGWIEWQEVSPDWYRPRRPYVRAIDHTDDKELVLTRLSDEGAIPQLDDIIDAKSGKVYRIPNQGSRLIAATESDIWVGYRSGITRINTETGQRTDYHVLPRFRRIAGWVDYKNTRYITTEDGDFLAMEISTGAISRIHIPDDVVTKMLSNPVAVNNTLYIGAVSRNIILLYDPDSKQWRHIKLEQIFGIRKLIVQNQTIWCIGNWRESIEGGDFVESGGLAAIMNGDQVTAFPELESIPIGGFRIDGDILRILTAKWLEAYDAGSAPQRSNELPEHRASDLIFNISLKTMKVEEKIPIINGSPAVNQFTPLRFTLSADEQEDISRWRVQAHVIEVTNQKVQIISREDFEKMKR